MIPKDATVREVLQALDEWMLHNNAGLNGPDGTWPSQGTKLWSVLSALRGPDSQRPDLKQATLHVRYAVFPLNAQACSFPALGVPASLEEALRIAREEQERTPEKVNHFADHIQFAAEALL